MRADEHGDDVEERRGIRPELHDGEVAAVIRPSGQPMIGTKREQAGGEADQQAIAMPAQLRPMA